jgi:N-acetylneuraminic acid mutarotase
VDFYEYNIASNTWSQKANFPGTARRDATSFVMNGKGYICFGYNGSSFLSDIWEYNYNSDTWTQKANFPGPARAAAVSFVIGKKAYVGTGAGNSAYLTDFWCYDQDLDTWTQKASLPGVGRRFASGFALQNYGYIGTGWDGSNDLKDFWEYNATLNSWSQIPDLTGDARSACSGFALGNRGFAGLGIDDGPDIYYSDLWEYTPSWSAINEAEINDDDFTVFPNLVADWITIENNNCSGKFNCKIIDINGRAITERTIDFSQEQLPKMNLLFIKSGRYFIVFEGNNGRIVKSFIKI